MPRRCRHAAAVGSLRSAMALAACTGTGTGTYHEPASEPSVSQAQASSGHVEIVADGFELPWSVVFHDGTALISERDSARILELADDGSTRVVGTVAGVAPVGEAGLLGRVS